MRSPDMGVMIVGAAVLYRDEVVDGRLVRREDSNTRYPHVQTSTRRPYSAVG